MARVTDSVALWVIAQSEANNRYLLDMAVRLRVPQ